METTTLMFGVGATKAGTSWLHRYLFEHPQCALPNIKELHYFNRIQPRQHDKEMLRLNTLRADLVTKSLIVGKQQAARLEVRISEVEDWIAVMQRGAVEQDAYLAFLNRNTGPGTRLVGDITPAYGLMNEATLADMAAMAPDTRFVLLLRDPLDRLWSNLRMMAGWRIQEGGDLGAKANHLFKRLLQGEEEGVAKRSDYSAMLTRLQNVVPAERLHIAFYEELFTQTAVDKICAFLGVDSHPGDFGRVVHASQPAELNMDRVPQVADMLIPHYDYVLGLMGELPGRWLQNREVLT